jgi:FMN phosphatase YigB (HAD superfamily)
MTILVDAVKTFIIEDFRIFREMYDLLEKYSNRKIIVTNAGDEQIIKFGLDKVPYEVFTMKHKPDKTDTKYFQILMRQYNLKSEDIIYFEHDKGAVESAKSLGVNTFCYDAERKDLNSLKDFLDIATKNSNAL